MKGYKQQPMGSTPASVITEDGAQHFSDGSSRPPGTYPFPPPPPFVLTSPIQVDYTTKPPPVLAETTAQSGKPSIAVGEPMGKPTPQVTVSAYRQTDGSLIFKDGSRKYANGQVDLPGSYSYPPNLGVLGDPGELVIVTMGGGQGTIITPTAYKPGPPSQTTATANEPPTAEQTVNMDPQAQPNYANFVIWAGPVNAMQAKGATLPGAKTDFLECVGSGTPTCAEIGAAMSTPTGRILPAILVKFKDPTDAKPWVAAFSAGGQIWKRAMLNAEDRFQIAGAILADAGYEAGWLNEKLGLGLPVIGYSMFIADAIHDDRVFVWTASSNPNPSVANPGTVYPSGAQTMAATLAEVELRTGVKFADVTSDPTAYPWGGRAPVKVMRWQNVILADYGSTYKHDEHATILAALVFAAIPAIVAVAPAATPGSVADQAGEVATGYWDRLRAWWGGASTATKGVTVAAAAAVGYGVASRKKG